MQAPPGIPKFTKYAHFSVTSAPFRVVLGALWHCRTVPLIWPGFVRIRWNFGRKKVSKIENFAKVQGGPLGPPRNPPQIGLNRTLTCHYCVDVGLNWLLETEVCLKKCQKYIQTTKNAIGVILTKIFLSFFAVFRGEKNGPKIEQNWALKKLACRDSQRGGTKTHKKTQSSATLASFRLKIGQNILGVYTQHPTRPQD